MKKLIISGFTALVSVLGLHAQDPSCYVTYPNLAGFSNGGFETSIQSVVCNSGTPNTYTITLRVEHNGCGGPQCKELSHFSVEADPGTYSNVSVNVISGNMKYGNIDMGPNLGSDPFDGFKIDNTSKIGDGKAGVFAITYTLDGLQQQKVSAKAGPNSYLAEFTAAEFAQVMTCNATSCGVSPTAVNDTAIGNFNVPKLIDVAANDNGNSSALDGTSVNFIAGTLPNASTEGTFSSNNNGTVTFTPVSGFTGSTSVQYEICNLDNFCATAYIYITIDAGTIDADGDGVVDASDDYPADPDRAFNNFYPAAGNGTLAFEDLWPGKGDFDMNDLVMNYRFKTVTNSSNNIVEVIGTFTIRSFGASFQNGFGFQLADNTISGSDISVSGYNLSENYISLGANGLEQAQNKPTIIVYDNTFNLMPHPGSGIGVNTDPSAIYVNPAVVTVTISFNSGNYTIADLNIQDFNPFIIANADRSREIHLPHYEPTALADVNLFGTGEDASDPSQGLYYITENNLPWGMNLPVEFQWPEEKVDIINAYLKFEAWAESGGTLFPDWYEDQTGYINSGALYQIP